MGYERGSIYLVDFNPAKGGEIGKLRPAIIISETIDNEILATVVVVPLSTKIVPDSYPYRLFLPKRGDLLKDSDACIYEIRALSKNRVKNYLARLTPKELEGVSEAMCQLFAKGEDAYH